MASTLPGAVWPAVLSPGANTALALLHQLEQNQWQPPEVIEQQQLRQLTALQQHAWTTVPWYREAWKDCFDPGAPASLDAVAKLPLLTRAHLRDHFETLKSDRCPPEHGQVSRQRTSGSTGAPVRFLVTAFTSLYWRVFTLRDHLWHRRDMSRCLAVVRYGSKLERASNWGVATAGLVETGPAIANSINLDAAELLDWLDAERPAYFFTHPSLLHTLARLSIRRGVRLEGLVEVRTLAESIGPDLRDLCREAWNVPLTDVYSSTDAGYMALQCPEHAHYHVQSEGVLLEVLDERGNHCGPGEIGRVVVTTLQNFAMPLIRYEIGDYAEVGPPCPCGRGLPVLNRILGRVRNMIVTPDGKTFWPAFGPLRLSDVLPIRQFQFIQRTRSLIEGRFVVDTPLDAAQEALLRERVLSKIPAGIEFTITYCDRIERSASGKFEDYISEVAGTL